MAFFSERVNGHAMIKALDPSTPAKKNQICVCEHLGGRYHFIRSYCIVQIQEESAAFETSFDLPDKAFFLVLILHSPSVCALSLRSVVSF